MKPLLLLDVDGVLSPTGRGTPPGYERHTTQDFDVVVRAEHGEWLRRLLPVFDAAWATTWGAQANEVYAPILGLPPFPVVPLDDLPREGTRKLKAVAEFAMGRPLAWVDDELYDDAEAWAADRSAPTLLRRTLGSRGLQKADVNALAAFARLLH